MHRTYPPRALRCKICRINMSSANPWHVFKLCLQCLYIPSVSRNSPRVLFFSCFSVLMHVHPCGNLMRREEVTDNQADLNIYLSGSTGTNGEREIYQTGRDCLLHGHNFPIKNPVPSFSPPFYYFPIHDCGKEITGKQ